MATRRNPGIVRWHIPEVADGKEAGTPLLPNLISGASQEPLRSFSGSELSKPPTDTPTAGAWTCPPLYPQFSALAFGRAYSSTASTVWQVPHRQTVF